jgi:hypothetical protein
VTLEAEVLSVPDLAGVAAQLGADLRRALGRAGATHQRAMAKRFVPYGAGDPIQTRSGTLRRSFGFEVREDTLRLFSEGAAYARIQEEGGTIRPKNKRYLTVPLPDALTPGGSLKGGARLVPRGRKYETADGDPTFIFRSKRGNLLVGARARNGATRLLYVLKTQVSLRARLGFRETFDRVTEPALRSDFLRAVETASNRLRAGGAA